MTSLSMSQLAMIQKGEKERGRMRLDWNVKWRRNIPCLVSIWQGLKVIFFLTKQEAFHRISNFWFCPGVIDRNMVDLRAFHVVLVIKNLPAAQETWVWSLSQEDPWRMERLATHWSILDWIISSQKWTWNNPLGKGAWWTTVHGVTESKMNEQ